jgi:ligand-binding sensor domain-containing protein
LRRGRHYELNAAITALILLAATAFAAEHDVKPAGQFGCQTWGEAEGLSTASVMAIAQTSDAYLWIGTETGLLRFDGVRFVSVPLDPAEPNRTDSISSLAADPGGGLWVGTLARGLFRIEGSSRRHWTTQQGLAGTHVLALAVARPGEVWAGTQLGLNRVGTSVETFTVRQGLPDNYVNSVAATPDGAIWVATFGGLAEWRAGQWRTYTVRDGLPSDRVYHVRAGRGGNL